MIIHFQLSIKISHMKRILTTIFISLIVSGAFSQSNSFITMRDTFKGGEDVHHFTVSGFFARAVLAWADEYEFREAITDIKNIRFITVPKSEFKSRNLSLNGFNKVLKEDSFEEVAHFRESGDYITFYIQENKKYNDRYFILIDSDDEVQAIELKGFVDMNRLMELKNQVAMSDN